MPHSIKKQAHTAELKSSAAEELRLATAALEAIAKNRALLAELSVEERIQRCQSDARQYLSVKPEAAWSRAKQAVSLLGESGQACSVV